MVELEIVKAMVATTPFEIVLELRPHIAHVEVPGVLLQLIDAVLPLAAALNEAMSLVA